MHWFSWILDTHSPSLYFHHMFSILSAFQAFLLIFSVTYSPENIWRLLVSHLKDNTSSSSYTTSSCQHTLPAYRATSWLRVSSSNINFCKSVERWLWEMQLFSAVLGRTTSPDRWSCWLFAEQSYSTVKNSNLSMQWNTSDMTICIWSSDNHSIRY